MMKRCMNMYSTTIGVATSMMTALSSFQRLEYCPWKKNSPVASGLSSGWLR